MFNGWGGFGMKGTDMRDKEHSQMSLLKDLVGYGLEIFLIRAKMARVDLLGFKDAIIKILICALGIMVVFFLGFICFLFGLNAVLSPEAKIWVFFGLAGLALVAIIGSVVIIMNALESQQHCLSSTLNGLQDDLAYLQGKKHINDIHIKEFEDDA